ncbi:APC family permease [Rothia uropygioeca]|uniref:APC family permease n=1 Tax=Kocuria sp. 257 TaxID=2021970 RepID=UPI0034121AED
MKQPQPPHLKRTLGTMSLTLFGLSYMAVGTVFTTYGIVNQLTEGHLVASYLVAVIVMLFTASSYAAMVRRYPVAGSAYTYVQQSFGGGLGFLAGWTLMLDYLFIPMINFLILGLYIGTQFPSVPHWVFILVALILVFVFNVLGISIVGKLNSVIVVVSLAAVMVFAVLAIKTALADPTAPALMDPFIPSSSDYNPVFTGAGVLALSFLGFDAVSTLSEEAKNARRDIPRAIMLTTILGGLIFLLVAWCGARAYHLDDWSQASQELLDAAGMVLFSHVGGEPLTVVFLIITVAGCFGSGLAGQVAVSRILYAMGRDGILPRPLGFLSKRRGTPVVAAAAVSVVALLSLVLSLDQAAYMISFGAIAAFALVNLCVIRTYLFPRGGRPRRATALELLRFGLVPLIGFGLSVWLWVSLNSLTWAIGGIWILVGFGILVAKTHGFRRPVPALKFSEPIPDTQMIDELGIGQPLKHHR